MQPSVRNDRVRSEPERVAYAIDALVELRMAELDKVATKTAVVTGPFGPLSLYGACLADLSAALLRVEHDQRSA